MINADYIHSQYRDLITHADFVALTERPAVRMSRFQRAALWHLYIHQYRSRRWLSRCSDDQCQCRYGEACPKEDHGMCA